MITTSRKEAQTVNSLASGSRAARLQQPVATKDVPTRTALANLTNKQRSLYVTTNQSQKIVKPIMQQLTQQIPRLPSAGNENIFVQKSESVIPSNQTLISQTLDTIGSQTPQSQKLGFNTALSNSATKGGIKVMHMLKSPGFDTQSAGTPNHMSEIAKEIITNMKEIESKFSVPDGWMESKEFRTASLKLITPYAREKLVDEVLKYCYTSGFSTPTICLAVNYFDRFIYQNPKRCTTDAGIVTAGLACAWIAAKYEEIHPPSVEQVAECYKLRKASLLEMEMQILSTLGYHCSICTIYPFLKRFLHTDLASTAVSQISHFLGQMTLLYGHFSSMKPSKLAAACLYVSRMINNETNTSVFPTMKKILGVCSPALKCPNTNFEADPKFWSAHANYYSGYELKEIFPEICAILKMLADYEKTPKIRVITTVFSDKKKGAACLKCREFMKFKGSIFGF